MRSVLRRGERRHLLKSESPVRGEEEETLVFDRGGKRSILLDFMCSGERDGKVLYYREELSFRKREKGATFTLWGGS